MISERKIESIYLNKREQWSLLTPLTALTGAQNTKAGQQGINI